MEFSAQIAQFIADELGRADGVRPRVGGVQGGFGMPDGPRAGWRGV